MSIEFFWIAVAAVTITSSARITRLVTYDKFPPVQWLRDKYADLTDRPRLLGWQLLAFCAYCASFWITVGVVLWGYLTDWQPVWWVVNGTFGASYLAAILMVHDGEPDDEPVEVHVEKPIEVQMQESLFNDMYDEDAD